MINKKLLFSVRESIPFIKKNVLYQWIGLVCNVLSTHVCVGLSQDIEVFHWLESFLYV